ncbi:MAG: hypothetical protein J6C19_04695 [Lachnospiraceae bacterium]|nr:hypothetical protein [Lachnospiraceae bacterium]
MEVQNIPGLMKLIYGDSTVREQNESIVKMLENIVQKYGQEAGNIIVKNSDILTEKDAEGKLFIILVMILLVLVYQCGQENLNNLYYSMKEQRRGST